MRETRVGLPHGPVPSEKHCKIEEGLKAGQAWAVESGGKLSKERGEERHDEEEDDEEDVPQVLESQIMEPCLAGLGADYLKDLQVVDAVRSGLLQAKDFGLDDGDYESEGSVVGSEEEAEFWECGEFWDDGE